MRLADLQAKAYMPTTRTLTPERAWSCQLCHQHCAPPPFAELVSKLRINFSQVGVGFVHMGGVHNFGYFASEQTLTFLTKRKVKLWFLLDRDEKEESEINKLAKKCSADASLKVLRKRELENYLIVPRVVAEFVGLKLRLADTKAPIHPPAEADVTKKIDEIAEKLKSFAIEKRVAKGTVQAAVSHTKANLRRRIGSRSSKNCRRNRQEYQRVRGIEKRCE
jgi:hypothetical protein